MSAYQAPGHAKPSQIRRQKDYAQGGQGAQPLGAAFLEGQAKMNVCVWCGCSLPPSLHQPQALQEISAIRWWEGANASLWKAGLNQAALGPSPSVVDPLKSEDRHGSDHSLEAEREKSA